MRKIFGIAAALVAAALLAVGITWTASASDEADAPTLVLDKSVVRAGETVHVSGDAGQESFNWVGSAAFVRQANDPYPGDGGSAVVTVDANGHYEGTATIGAVAPGDYSVTVRIGGGNAGNVTLTVVA